MAEPIARYYDESKNSDGGSFPGVPLRDLTEEEFSSLPEWLQRSVDASPIYRKTKPRAERPADDEASAPKARRATEATEGEPKAEG